MAFCAAKLSLQMRYPLSLPVGLLRRRLYYSKIPRTAQFFQFGLKTPASIAILQVIWLVLVTS